ncbi:Uncharacterized protein YP598_1384 [Yersinia pseudotuberculosis]|nr:Uncharacterized protein YP598_1384 [Yersinia pseudotuberculosis]
MKKRAALGLCRPLFLTIFTHPSDVKSHQDALRVGAPPTASQPQSFERALI